MVTLEDAKALLCKKRYDSFAIADDDSEGSSLLCKWRSDSFVDVDDLPAIQTCAERELDKHKQMSMSSAVSSASSTSTYDSVLRANRRNEVAYLEALAAHAHRCESSGQSSMSTRPGRKPRQSMDKGRNRRSTVGVPSSVLLSRVEASFAESEHKDQDRFEAMQIASREAAIRETLEREMQNACNNGQVQSLQMPASVSVSSTMPPSPARARGSAQPLQLSSQRSVTPRSRASLHIQPAQKLMAHPTAQRASSFGAESFRQAADPSKLQSASSFSQSIVSPRSVSFGQLDKIAVGALPMGRSASFGQIDKFRILVPQQSHHTSPASSRSASFDLGHAVQRSSSASMTVPSSGPTPLPMPLLAGKAQVPEHNVPSSLAMQRAANLVEEQAQLAARLNHAAEMIDNLQLDHAVLDEAKRLTELHKLRQVQQQQRRQPPQSPRSAMPLPAYQRSTPQSPARARSGSASVFWRPPPEAAQLCARCPSLETMPRAPGRQPSPSTGMLPRALSNSSFDLSWGVPPSPTRV